MQKVEGSNPFSRLSGSPLAERASLFPGSRKARRVWTAPPHCAQSAPDRGCDLTGRVAQTPIGENSRTPVPRLLPFLLSMRPPEVPAASSGCHDMVGGADLTAPPARPPPW